MTIKRQLRTAITTVVVVGHRSPATFTEVVEVQALAMVVITMTIEAVAQAMERDLHSEEEAVDTITEDEAMAVAVMTSLSSMIQSIKKRGSNTVVTMTRPAHLNRPVTPRTLLVIPISTGSIPGVVEAFQVTVEATMALNR